jgi:hypothetical protein
MPSIKSSVPSICARCLYRQTLPGNTTPAPRHFSRLAHLQAISGAQAVQDGQSGGNDQNSGAVEEGEKKGALSRRLEEMTHEALESSPRRAQKMVEESGFSEELKARLEARIAGSQMKSENPSAFAYASLPSSADKGARDTAAALPWAGTERLEDAALRMLEDAHKPLSRSLRVRSKPRAPPMSVDMRMKQAARVSPGQRLANARDKTSVYSLTQDQNLSEQEKEDFRRELKERFSPGARAMPNSLAGLQSLASERIENAIARGQFKNIPRGKGVNVERDYNANSPFIDTTEYFMNKMIQRQDILPPWVEKQQEVAKQSARFRGRLRNDWKRHAARTIASKGGTLEQQIRRAEAYAKAEEIVNPKKAKEESVSTIDPSGSIKTVTITETPKTAEQGADITVTQSTADPGSAATSDTTTSTIAAAAPEVETIASTDVGPAPHPFRDPQWEAAELSYHKIALESLNSLTRSYNLMAPELAKKPYFNLERELRSCFADTAPLVAHEIRERARAPPKKAGLESIGHTQGGILERFGGQTARVYDSTKPMYGFKEMWRDLFARKQA